MCVKVFNYAIEIYELPIKRNYAINLDSGEKEKSEQHSCWTEVQEQKLWNSIAQKKSQPIKTSFFCL